MRVQNVGIACLGLLLGGCRSPGSSAIPEARADEPARADARAVVVELFTSEGCSSCPPADAILADLAADRHVLALSFHVDYWNELGWPDPFSSPDNTSRQRAYAAAFRARGLYTPQLVVDGIDGFAGTDRAQAQADIESERTKPPQVTLSPRARASGDGWISVELHASGAPAGAVANVALVQRGVTSQVRAGENAGRTLRHVDVVRAFTTSAAGSSDPVRIRLPAGLQRSEAEVIVFVQAAAGSGPGLPVLGAARVDLGS